jgi:DNA invertase Pin-like site-specific DNA recombinase
MVGELEEFARRLNVPVAEVIAERDVSAWTNGGERKGRWPEVWDGLATGRWDALVVRSLDRCARDMVETIRLAQLCAQVGFGFYALNGDSLGHELLAAVSGWKNAQESKDKSDRLKLMHAAKAARGDYQPGRYRPFGYQLVKNEQGIYTSLSIDPAEAPIVREMAQRIIAGESLHMIALDLESRNIRTVSGAAWRPSTVKRAVLKPCAAGLRGKGEIAGSWEPIIDMETYLLAQAALKPDRAYPAGHNARKHLLSGFLVCGLCGVPLTCNGRIYQCSKRSSRGITRGCGGIGRKKELIDELITDLVVAHLEQLDLETEQTVIEDWTPAITAAQQEEALIQQAYEAGEITAAQWLQGLKVARSKRSDAELGQQAALAKARGLATMHAAGAGVRERFAALNLSQQRAIISELFDAIIVHRAGKGGHVFRPELIEPIWRKD